MESLHEQIAYGDYCKHGTPIGTPGGADLMCGLCEMGYDRWVDDPRYALVWDWEHSTMREIPNPAGVEWRLSTINHPATIAAIQNWVGIATSVGDLRIVFWVVRRDSGYWDEDER